MKIGNSKLIKDAERYIKRCIKGRYKFSKALVISFLISGFFSSVGYGGTIFLENNAENDNGGGNKSTAVWSDEGIKWNNYALRNKLKGSESIILSHIDNTAGAETSLTNKDFSRTVVIGSRAVAGGSDSTAIGYRAITGKNRSDTTANQSHQGTAVGYRAFANGTESVSMGNDTIAWGESSIAIGSDNATGKESRPLSKEIYKLFHALRDDFNYTNEYSVVNHTTLRKDKYGSLNMLDNDGNLIANDGFYIGYNGGYYFRKPDKSGKYLLKDGLLYEETSGGFSKIENKKDYDRIMKSLKNNDDYRRYENYMDILERDYQLYKASPTKTKTHTWARGNNSIAIGGRSIAFGNNSTALGTASVAARDYATAIGSDSIAYGKGSLAVGNRAFVYSDESVGIGNKVQALNSGAMVYGKESFAGGTGSLAIGDHTFANVTMKNDFNSTVENLYSEGDTDTIQNSHKDKFYPETKLQDGTGEKKSRTI